MTAASLPDRLWPAARDDDGDGLGRHRHVHQPGRQQGRDDLAPVHEPPSLTAAISNNIVVSPAAATQLVIHTQPAATATAFVPFNPQPVIYVEDQFGNLETGDNSTQVTASLNSGTGPLLGTTTVTVAGGVATFTNLANATAETITLQFTSVPVLSSAISNAIVVGQDVPYQLVVQTQPSSAATAGQPFPTQPVIYVEDQAGNLVVGDNTTQVTVALRVGTGPLLGTTTVTASGGIATFTNLMDDKAETILLDLHCPESGQGAVQLRHGQCRGGQHAENHRARPRRQRSSRSASS